MERQVPRFGAPILARRWRDGVGAGGAVKDVVWLAPTGREMSDDMWNEDFVRSVGMVLAGDAIEDVNERGEPIIGDTLLILLSADADDIPFTLPPVEGARQWQRVFDTSEPDALE